jgi:parallel beta-helix repeat protein
MSSIFSAYATMSTLRQSPYFTWGLTALSIGAISASAIAPSAHAQTAYTVAAQRGQTTDYTYRYVHPTQGNDANSGSADAPLRTLTQAIATAPENTIIVLSPGTYSAASGERFPLMMKSGVTIQGEPSDRGQRVIISGSGVYLSRSFARQNITILGANRAGLRGVTITNPQPQGYGLWIESSSPVISDSTFIGSTHDGVSIVGSSAPLLKNNTFTQNGANGITIYGYSHPELVENTFENTGFGINIAQNAAPRLIRNRIQRNKDGIVIQGNATPILRQNIISDNSRDGLVAISNAQPHLGNTSEAGENQFARNGNLDVNAAASSQVIPAVGNQFDKINGNLDRRSTTIASTRTAQRIASRTPVIRQPIQRVSDTRIGSDTTDPGQPALAQTPIVPPTETAIDLPLLRLPAVPSKLAPKLRPIALPVDPSQLMPGGNLTSSGRALPVVPELRVSKPSVFGGTAPAETVTPTPAIDQPGSQPEGGGSIPIAVPLPEASTPVQTSEKPRLSRIILADRGITATPPAPSANILPVPSGEIPVGNTGGESTVWRSPTPRPTFRLRVYVAGLQLEQITQLKQLVPGAFSTVIQGQSVVQIGAFNDRPAADALANQISTAGFTATIENY